MGDIDINGIVLWAGLFWVISRQPQVHVVRERFTLRSLFSRSPRTDP